MAAIEKKTKRYPSDLTDEEWSSIEPLLPQRAETWACPFARRRMGAGTGQKTAALPVAAAEAHPASASISSSWTRPRRPEGTHQPTLVAEGPAATRRLRPPLRLRLGLRCRPAGNRPATGDAFALVLPEVSTEALQTNLP
jgi:hypothetical protein